MAYAVPRFLPGFTPPSWDSDHLSLPLRRMINVRKSTLKNQIFNTTRHGRIKASRLIKHISPINMGGAADQTYFTDQLRSFPLVNRPCAFSLCRDEKDTKVNPLEARGGGKVRLYNNIMFMLD